MKRFIPYVCLIVVVFSCNEKTEKNKVHNPLEVKVYQEPYRPQYHFTPREKWMNDPNGLVYNEGIYHLFYQYYPDDIVWGPMHWGHATSIDMVHWQHKPIALYPDENGLIFSGSAVVDKNNTSGFGTDGKAPMVAVYTYHLMEGEKAGRNDFQTQGIAYSLDNGHTWTKYAGNPIIGNEGIRDFRDPKVFWHDQSKRWILTLVAGDHAKFYSSSNLKDWKYLSDFGKEKGAHGGVWECPDLFPLKVEGTDEEKWVLIISINPGAPNGGSGTQYFIGDFDGTNFVSDQEKIKWLDWGSDNYAGVTYNNTPNDERIFIGWMSNWKYARDTPTEKWRSAMTVPRSLSLAKISNSYVLKGYPLTGIMDLAIPGERKTVKIGVKERVVNKMENFNQSQIKFATNTKDLSLMFNNAAGDMLLVVFDEKNQKLVLDRTKSGKVAFQKEFGEKAHDMPIKDLPEEFEVRILMDWSSIEIFINKGQFVMTEQIFPTENYTDLIIQNLSATEMELRDFSIEKMQSIWD